jgi:tRNA-dihydrouridine synthase
MEGYSNSVLRTLMYRHGADLTFTEMTHIESILKRNKGSLEKLNVKDSTPVQIQILSSNEKKLDRYLSIFKFFEGFKGFNLNLSCPSRNVINHGKGAAMVKRAAKTRKLVSVIRDYNFPVSIKIRLGLNQFEKDNKLYLNNLGGVDPDFFIVHAKHAGQTSREPADFSVYDECVQEARGIPVIANGGIDSSDKVNMLRCQGISGVMIGRPALNNPFIFNKIKNEMGLNNPPKTFPGVKALKAEYQSIHNEHCGNTKYLSSYTKILDKWHPRVLKEGKETKVI